MPLVASWEQTSEFSKSALFSVAAGSVIGVISLITLFSQRKSLNQFAAPT